MPLPLPGGRPRALLALLLLHRNEIVSVDRLIDALWPDAPPTSARKAVQVYVVQLRRILGEGPLLTRGPGYSVRMAPDQLDLERFERLVASARRAAPAGAATALHEALALWRGAPLADVADGTFAQLEIARLEDLRLAALEARVDADLALGAAGELVPELEAAAAAHPLRERLWAQLMIALYRDGRQAKALETYQRARRLLAEEVGLEPGAALQELERAILRQAPELIPEPALAVPPAAVSPRTILVAGGGDAALVLAATLAPAHPPHEVLLAEIVEPQRLGEATATLRERREALLARGTAARAAAFSSAQPGRDLVRLATEHESDLVVTQLDGIAEDELLGRAPCDVALVTAVPAEGSVVVPFGAAEHDWAALELGAWFARAAGRQLRLAGSLVGSDGGDSSRLLADASLIVQRVAGVVAEPTLVEPGLTGVRRAAAGAGLVVVGLSDRWQQEGLGRVRSALAADPPAPLVFVRRGLRPGGLVAPDDLTRFTWSLGGSA